jgi:hypothetical protein
MSCSDRKGFIQQPCIAAGRKKGAAELLGLTFRSFRYRLSKLNLESVAVGKIMKEMWSDKYCHFQGGYADFCHC